MKSAEYYTAIDANLPMTRQEHLAELKKIKSELEKHMGYVQDWNQVCKEQRWISQEVWDSFWKEYGL